MNDQKWIMSEGGPLIAVERELQSLWGGICRLTVAAQGASNDYDRPPQKLDYIQPIDLQRGRALIFGEGPIDTAFWHVFDHSFFIIRTIYCNPDFNCDEIMRRVDKKLLDNPVEQMEFRFSSPILSIFDSAEDGSRSDISSIEARIKPGSYRIGTILHEPDDTACLIIHYFHRSD